VTRKALTTLLLFLASALSLVAQDVTPTPQLLLNAQRLRRLKRDRERKTSRWVNFENRVNTVPDSPERGFELALYYAITGDEAKGREAVSWALSHHSARQSQLLLDWCAPLVSDDQKKKLVAVPVIINGQMSFQLARDIWFGAIASGAELGAPGEDSLRPQFNSFIDGRYRNVEELYALCELIYAVRAATHADLRDTDTHFFSILPSLLLLSAKPKELNSPDWKLHAAALALVALDPNLPASQFLQSWALEDAQTLREGPGVAYELLWADPYLPGVGYQNMDPWVYDEHGRFFARSSWEPNSCWIEISAQGIKQENCPPNWQNETVTFGRLTLIPVTDRCVEIPHVANNEAVLVWKLKPGQRMTYGRGREQHTIAIDPAGLWRPGAGVEGRICLSAH
jgi:hypothetical protein